MATLTQTQIDDAISLWTETEYNTNRIYLEKTFTQSNAVSKKARAIFLFARPIEFDGKRYKNYLDDDIEQDEKMADFSDDLIEAINKVETELKVRLYNTVWYDSELDKIVLDDFGLAFASFLFVLIYVSFTIESFFMGT